MDKTNPTRPLSVGDPTRADYIRNETVEVTGLSNREFLERYASPGRVGLSGGIKLVDRAISRAERHLDEQGRWSYWSHAFLFQGQRHDGHHWVVESDLHIARKHIRLGVQENRVAKYFDEEFYTTLAVLDFGLAEEQVATLLREGLELVATRARYSLRELVGTMLALRRPELREQDNVMARECSFYCSAFIEHLFRRSGIDLTPGRSVKNTTPEDISRTSVPHITYLLKRRVATSKLSELATRVHQKVRARICRGEKLAWTISGLGSQPVCRTSRSAKGDELTVIFSAWSGPASK